MYTSLHFYTLFFYSVAIFIIHYVTVLIGVFNQHPQASSRLIVAHKDANEITSLAATNLHLTNHIWRRKRRREKRCRRARRFCTFNPLSNHHIDHQYRCEATDRSLRDKIDVFSSSDVKSLENAGMNGILKCLDSHLRWIKSNYASAVILNGRRSGNVHTD